MQKSKCKMQNEERPVSEYPIVFCGEMVRAILAGRKTQTRRMINPQPPHGCRYDINGNHSHAVCVTNDYAGCVPPTPVSSDHRLPCPYGKPGDRLWVRERVLWWSGGAGGTHSIVYCDDPKIGAYLLDQQKLDQAKAADDNLAVVGNWEWCEACSMPRWASRIMLEVVCIHVEQVQDISRLDANAEGFFPEKKCTSGLGNSQLAFRKMWDSINPQCKFCWDANPWVWVVEFKMVAK